MTVSLTIDEICRNRPIKSAVRIAAVTEAMADKLRLSVTRFPSPTVRFWSSFRFRAACSWSNSANTQHDPLPGIACQGRIIFEFEHWPHLPSDRHLTSPLAFANGTRYWIYGNRPEQNAFSVTSPPEPTMEEFR